jgi:hypothetical protein
MNETFLSGGRVTPGVARVGDTVRRSVKPASPFVRLLLAELEARGFDAAPRHLGVDDQGRDVLTYLAGAVPDELDACALTQLSPPRHA